MSGEQLTQQQIERHLTVLEGMIARERDTQSLAAMNRTYGRLLDLLELPAPTVRNRPQPRSQVAGGAAIVAARAVLRPSTATGPARDAMANATWKTKAPRCACSPARLRCELTSKGREHDRQDII